jgi:hypothetical protein
MNRRFTFYTQSAFSSTVGRTDASTADVVETLRNLADQLEQDADISSFRLTYSNGDTDTLTIGVELTN